MEEKERVVVGKRDWNVGVGRSEGARRLRRSDAIVVVGDGDAERCCW